MNIIIFVYAFCSSAPNMEQDPAPCAAVIIHVGLVRNPILFDFIRPFLISHWMTEIFMLTLKYL